MITGFMREQSVIPYQTLDWTRLVQHRRTKGLNLGARLKLHRQLPSLDL